MMNNAGWLSERDLLWIIAIGVALIAIRLTLLSGKLGPMIRHYEKLEDDEIERDIDSSA
jgi:hypothetical protein